MKTIRFFSVNRDGTENRDYGTATLADDGQLEYANDRIEGIMAPMVARVGPAKAFAFYNPWSNGYVCSEPVVPAPAA